MGRADRPAAIAYSSLPIFLTAPARKT